MSPNYPSAWTRSLFSKTRPLFEWWLHELAGMLPQSLARLTGTEPRSTIRLLFGKEPALHVLRKGHWTRLEIPPNLTTQDPAHQTATTEIRRRRSAGLIIEIDSPAQLQVDIVLPVSAERSLRQIIDHQITKHVPLTRSEVCFDIHGITRKEGGRTLAVKVIVAKRATIDSAVALAQKLGLSPKLVVAKVTDLKTRGGKSPIPWQTGLDIAQISQSNRRIRRTLEAACVALLVAAYCITLWKLDNRSLVVQAKLSEMSNQARDTQTLSQKVSLLRNSALVVRKREHEPSSLQILAELTDLMPSDMWATEFSVRGRTIEISGFAPKATELPTRLESSPYFHNPHFRAPITSSADGKVERFDLTVEIADAGQ